MAEYRVEVNRRFTGAFPSVGLPVYFGAFQSERYGLPDGLPESESYGTSPLGTPLWDAITVRVLSTGLEYTFPNDPLIDAYLRKKETQTEVFGGKSVIESAGLKATQFRLRGVLWEDNGSYPEEQLSELLEVFLEDTELEVVSSRYFNYLGITNLFISDLSMRAVEGYSDSQGFVISARETRDIELSIFET